MRIGHARTFPRRLNVHVETKQHRVRRNIHMAFLGLYMDCLERQAMLTHLQDNSAIKRHYDNEHWLHILFVSQLFDSDNKSVSLKNSLKSLYQIYSPLKAADSHFAKTLCSLPSNIEQALKRLKKLRDKRIAHYDYFVPVKEDSTTTPDPLRVSSRSWVRSLHDCRTLLLYIEKALTAFYDFPHENTSRKSLDRSKRYFLMLRDVKRHLGKHRAQESISFAHTKELTLLVERLVYLKPDIFGPQQAAMTTASLCEILRVALGDQASSER